jgi:beta-RFAP synthase
VPSTVAVTIRSTVPSHAGFGSGTQLALATAAGLAGLHRGSLVLAEAAAALDRGNRSGIGLAAFVDGGLIVDGGRGQTDAPPPVIARAPFPEAWRVVLVLDKGMQGVHGTTETAAFGDLPSFPETEAAHLCRLALMQILPAVAEADLVAFGSGIGELQRCLGDFFAPLQGGRFASPAVAAALRRIEELGIKGVGQSSWGPTGFAIVGSQGEAEQLLAELTRRSDAGGLKYLIARGRNEGAEISIHKAEPRSSAAGSRRA